MFIRASRICCVGIWRRFSHLRRPLYEPNSISSVSIAPYSVSKWKASMSSVLTPISLRQSLNRPIQSLKVPIFATFPGIKSTSNSSKHFVVPSIRPSFARLDGQECPSPHELFCFEHRRPLFHVCGQAFLCVFTLEEQLLILAFDGEGGFHRNLPAGLHRTLDAAHGLGSLVRRAKLFGILHDVFHEAVALVNVVDDAQLLR